MTGAQPYEHLAQVYDRWTADNDYAGWFGFIEQEWRGRPGQVRDVLEVCAGTGTVLEHFAARGYRVTGLDRSETMLDQARRKLGEDVELIRAELPELPAEGPFDAVLCLFDSLNYLGDDGSLRETLRAVARVLRPGGTFIFDVNSVRKLGDVFGLSHYGDDLGDFAYVWQIGRAHV